MNGDVAPLRGLIFMIDIRHLAQGLRIAKATPKAIDQTRGIPSELNITRRHRQNASGTHAPYIRTRTNLG